MSWCGMQSWAIDVGAIATFAFLLKRDLKARDKQVCSMGVLDLVSSFRQH